MEDRSAEVIQWRTAAWEAQFVTSDLIWSRKRSTMEDSVLKVSTPGSVEGVVWVNGSSRQRVNSGESLPWPCVEIFSWTEPYSRMS